MRISVTSLRLLGAASLTLTGAAACASSSAIPPAMGGTALPATGSTAPLRTSNLDLANAKKKHKKLLYVADYDHNQVLVFDQTKKQSPKPAYIITKGVNKPTGLATDAFGNLYVANYDNPGTDPGAGSLSIFGPGAKSPIEVITTGVNGPEAVAVDSGGDIFVANQPIYGSGGPWINEYPAGSTSPSFTWYPPQGSFPVNITGLAILSPNAPPSQTDIYATFFTSNGSIVNGDVMDCYPGQSPCVSLNYSLGQTGGIAVEQPPSGSSPFDFLVVDQYLPGIINFTSGSQSWEFKTGGTPQYLALNSTHTDLYVSNLGSVVDYTYPGMKVVTSFHSPHNGAQFLGVAVSPSGSL